MIVERPTSRLSNRMTQNPCAASFSQNASSHITICEESPITSRSGALDFSPNVS
jgi:hypothetical protein